MDRAVFHFSSVPEKIREVCAARGFFRVGLEQADVEMIRGLARPLEPHYRATTSISLLLFDRALIDFSILSLRGGKLDAALPLETLAVERVERATEWYLLHLEKRPMIDALTQLRLGRASQMLATIGDTLDVVARQCGFNSES